MMQTVKLAKSDRYQIILSNEKMEYLCERLRKLVHKELQIQDLDTLTYKAISNISRNMRKARSSQMLPLPTDIEETHEALNAVQVSTSSKEKFCLLLIRKKKFYCFLAKPT
jgi:hypothetical protein